LRVFRKTGKSLEKGRLFEEEIKLDLAEYGLSLYFSHRLICWGGISHALIIWAF